MWYGMVQYRAATDVRGRKNRTVKIISLKKMLTLDIQSRFKKKNP